MTKRKDGRSKAEPRSKQRKSKLAEEFASPSERERLPLHVPETYQVAMGRSEEIAVWLRGVPRSDRVILIQFPNEASYRKYGPFFWYVANRLPEIVARVQRRRFEQLVDAMTQLLLSQSGAVPAAIAGARGTRAKEAPSRRSRGNSE